MSDDKEKKMTQIARVENYLGQRLDFKRNVVTQRVECKAKAGTTFHELNLDSIYRMLLYAGFKVNLDVVRSLFRSDFVKEYNPFTEYFQKLPKWDGKTDHINELAGYIKAEDQEFFNVMFKKTLVRCLACSLDNIPNRMVLVFVSLKQEIGKSWFIQFLSPFGINYYSEAPLTDNKDTYFRLSENFIINLEELASLKNTEINQLKAIISMATIKERKPYEVHETIQPRRANFFGSTNRPEFLLDTENTRWICIAIRDVDHNYSKEIDIHKVWAQAYHLYKSGFNYGLTKEEKEQRDALNQEYEVSYPEKDMLNAHFVACDKNDREGRFMSIADIMDSLHLLTALLLRNSDRMAYNPVRINQYAIVKALTSLGFKRDRKIRNGKQVRGYYLKLGDGKYRDKQMTFDDLQEEIKKGREDTKWWDNYLKGF